MKKDEPTLIHIKGENKTAEEIYQQYISHMEKGYTLTIDQICEYLDCSYLYVLQNIKPKLPYIRINTKARQILYRMSENQENDPYSPLFKKRILFHDKSFRKYIQKIGIMEKKYVQFDYQDFSKERLNNIKKFILEHNKSAKKEITLKQVIQHSINTLTPKYYQPATKRIPLKDFPDELYSLKKIQEKYNIPHAMMAYRMLAEKGIHKIFIGNLVRYQGEELEKNPLGVMYDSLYCELKKSVNVMQTIEEKSLQYMQELNRR